MKKVCPKSGIKIHDTPSQMQTQTRSTNMFSVDDFTNKHFSPQITTSNIDLDIDNYSCDDLFKLLCFVHSDNNKTFATNCHGIAASGG